MNLNHLRFVLEVERTQSFTKASKMCCVSQPSLSTGIRQIEDQLGGRIFERTTRSVSLTPFGHHIISSIQQIADAQTELKKTAEHYFKPQHKLLAIGLSPLADMRMINALINPYLGFNSDVMTFFKECFMESLDARISDGQIAVAIRLRLQTVNEISTNNKSAPFYSEPVFVIPRDGDTKLRKSSGPVSIKDLAEETFVLTPNGCGHAPATRGWFRDSGIPLNEYQGQAVSYKVMQDWAELGLASAILPWSKISDGNRRRARPLILANGKPALAIFELVWNRDRIDVTPLSSFLEFFNSNCEAIVAGLHFNDEKFNLANPVS